MCNPAEQSGVDYASDTKRINGFVAEADHLPICVSTNAGTVVESNEASDHRSNDTLELSGGKVRNSGQENVVNGSCCQEVAKTLDQERELSKTCISMTPSFLEDDGIVHEGMQTPTNVYVEDYPETSEHSFNSNVVSFKDDAHPFFAEDRRIETMPMDTKTLIEDTLSDTTSKWIEEVKFEKEALQPMRKGTSTLTDISKDFPEQVSIEVVKIPNSTLVSCVNELAVKGTEEVMVESCNSAAETETRMNMRHAGHKGEVDNTSLLVGLVGGSADHSKGPCAETEDARFGNISSPTVIVPEVEQVKGSSAVKCDPESLEETSSTIEHVPIDFKEVATWIEIRPGTSEGVTEQLARNPEETSTLESQNTAKEIELTYEHTGQVVMEIDEDLDKLIPGMAMSSKEAAAEQAAISLEELRKNVVKQGGVFEEAHSEIQQEGFILSPVHVAAMESSVSKGTNGPVLAEFFNNARDSKLEKEIEEQDHVPIMVKSPPKKKTFMESPRSLRMLLFSNETTLPIEKDEKHKKDGKGIDFSGKAAPAAESNGHKNHTDDNYPTKWHENVDSADTSSDFSVPITFSGALTYQGVISYSGQVAYSGSISHRSDSSASTRSFAFPILASDWNTSPVKMGPPDPRYFQRQRKWHGCFCCRRSSTLFD